MHLRTERLSCVNPGGQIIDRQSLVRQTGPAIAAAAAQLGARVTLVSGLVIAADPGRRGPCGRGNCAREMAEAVKHRLPVDVAIMVAAVADWRTLDVASEKMKKRGSAPPALRLTENPDILADGFG